MLEESRPHLGLRLGPVRGTHRREVVDGTFDACRRPARRARPRAPCTAFRRRRTSGSTPCSSRRPPPRRTRRAAPAPPAPARRGVASATTGPAGSSAAPADVGAPAGPRPGTSSRPAAARGPGRRAGPCPGTVRPGRTSARRRRSRRVAVLGEVVVGDEPERHVVVLLVHVGQQMLRAARPRAPRPPGRRTYGSRVPSGSIGRGEAVPFAGEGDAVVAVADGLVQRRVVPAGEQVVVDQPVALRHAQPGLQVGASPG